MKNQKNQFSSNRHITYSCKYHVIFCSIREEFSILRRKLPTLWTHSYFIATVGGAPLGVIKKYIEDQKYV